MRHINTDSALPRECKKGTSQEEDEEEEGGEEEEGEEEGLPRPWCRHHGVLMGCSPPELTCQKVYQVSIFSPLAGCSHPPEQRSPGRQPVKRTCPGPQRVAEEGEWDAKRGCWEEDDAIEDGLLVDELSLGGSAQHFSHSGLRVVEHRQEGSPSRPCGGSPARARGRTADATIVTMHEPRTPCDNLHTTMRDYASSSLGDLPSASGNPWRQEENGTQQDEGGSGSGSTPRLSSHRLLLDPDLHNLAHPLGEPDSQMPCGGHTQPDTSVTLVAQGPSTHPGPDSAEKTPCSSARLLGGSGSGYSAKRKLLPSIEGATETGSEDEGLPPARKKRVLQSPTVPASCRSTDAKGAPFWNHLLPAAKGMGTQRTDASPSDPTGDLSAAASAGLQQAAGPLQALGPPPPPAVPSWGTLRRSIEDPPSLVCIPSFLLCSLPCQESMLKGRFPPSGRIEGFTAEIGASGSYCPQHATLPVEVTYFDIAEHSTPSPFLGVIDLEALGKKGYSIPKTGTIQVTLFNPNKTVVKMFLVTYDFHDMPANHVTFLRHRIFLVPVDEEQGASPALGKLPRREATSALCSVAYGELFHSSKSGKIYLHDDIRLLFSRKSIEIDSGIPYELKSFTEVPRNPCYSPRA
ncbi:hypothetical protein JD844_008042 [Phrynosoma platyrhinos]|uniref:Atos homolog protein B n=2 Tax=Toxicofera TaxID=1329911 RepID=A0ABQ7TE97_PHRPL|nr:hypothetical protein JD844_008042 [Phrynosoma platyrhinos]